MGAVLGILVVSGSSGETASRYCRTPLSMKGLVEAENHFAEAWIMRMEIICGYKEARYGDTSDLSDVRLLE